MSLFKTAREHLDLLRRLEAKGEAKCRWTDPAERAEYLRERARLVRLKWLDLLVPERKCPCCDRTKASSRSWVIFPLAALTVPEPRVIATSREGECCVCRSCATKLKVLGEGSSRGRLK